MPQTVVIRGKGWTIERSEDVREYARRHGYDMSKDELDGVTIHKERLICVDSTIDAMHRLEIEIHEMLHAYDPTWTERRVRTMGRTLAKALWKLGYRPSLPSPPADDI